MKIVAINGSPRKDGNLSQVLEVVRKEVEAAGVEFEVFQPGPKVHPCLACYKCLENGDLQCIQKDDMVNDIIRACIEADGILLTSPVYHGGIAGGMKCVLDRLALAAGCGENQFHHKVGAALCTLRRSGGHSTYHELLSIMDAFEMVIVTSDYWGAVHGADPGECQKDIEGMEVAAKLGRNMAWMVKTLHYAKDAVPVPETHHRTMFNYIRD
ncbi:MAG: flavodoxin family protein [Lachnospiraceae bacterium]|nr:flavodoxin family protein [Lachnospiraceae bacterium]